MQWRDLKVKELAKIRGVKGDVVMWSKTWLVRFQKVAQERKVAVFEQGSFALTSPAWAKVGTPNISPLPPPPLGLYFYLD